MDNQGDQKGNGVATAQTFWCEQARNQLIWFKDFHTVLDWRPPYAEWFLGGKLNASFNCLDRHLEEGRGSHIAVRWEGEKGETTELSYSALHEAVCRFANALKTLGIERGDRVAIYLPDIPEIVITMLACARIGAVHSVINCEYSSDSLMDRINDATASLVVTADVCLRAGVPVPLLQQCDEALQNTPSVNHLVVVRRTGDTELPDHSRDLWFDELLASAEAECRPEPLASEELLYLLYTSGATGRPKGIMHTTAGFLTQVAFTHEYVFGSNRDHDVFWCTFAAASAPGHSYGIYGALLHGSTTLLCEGPAGIPEPDRIGEIISRHRVTQLYTSPATVRLMMGQNPAEPLKNNFSSLRAWFW